MEKIKNIQKRALGLLLNDDVSNYETLLLKTNKCTMEVQRLKALVVETFRVINKMNPNVLHDLFKKGSNSLRRQNDLMIPKPSTVRFGDKSTRCLGPHI